MFRQQTGQPFVVHVFQPAVDFKGQQPCVAGLDASSAADTGTGDCRFFFRQRQQTGGTGQQRQIQGGYRCAGSASPRITRVGSVDRPHASRTRRMLTPRDAQILRVATASPATVITGRRDFRRTPPPGMGPNRPVLLAAHHHVAGGGSTARRDRGGAPEKELAVT